jgi:hypothetical protein
MTKQQPAKPKPKHLSIKEFNRLVKPCVRKYLKSLPNENERIKYFLYAYKVMSSYLFTMHDSAFANLSGSELRCKINSAVVVDLHAMYAWIIASEEKYSSFSDRTLNRKIQEHVYAHHPASRPSFFIYEGYKNPLSTYIGQKYELTDKYAIEWVAAHALFRLAGMSKMPVTSEFARLQFTEEFCYSTVGQEIHMEINLTLENTLKFVNGLNTAVDLNFCRFANEFENASARFLGVENHTICFSKSIFVKNISLLKSAIDTALLDPDLLEGWVKLTSNEPYAPDESDLLPLSMFVKRYVTVKENENNPIEQLTKKLRIN